ncbi:MAG: hypothetical protein A2234_07270 [Elusimicrobia bacterium RIFOXYA2_FULL_58_8]|nr:MAG: hypothetical protein A2234_07270 [Elusimicrobia bacterium RIFOXYA2_FULL_58_8]OGS13315.1 MAG: hypothetical protein A2285_02045 [Elusimicrobia bacterium RIFOXYA12_FULL_57_11]
MKCMDSESAQHHAKTTAHNRIFSDHGARNVTFGTGLRRNTTRLDCSFSPLREIDSIHRIYISPGFAQE